MLDLGEVTEEVVVELTEEAEAAVAEARGEHKCLFRTYVRSCNNEKTT